MFADNCQSDAGISVGIATNVVGILRRSPEARFRLLPERFRVAPKSNCAVGIGNSAALRCHQGYRQIICHPSAGTESI
jgi:hypothetical protein